MKKLCYFNPSERFILQRNLRLGGVEMLSFTRLKTLFAEFWLTGVKLGLFVLRSTWHSLSQHTALQKSDDFCKDNLIFVS